MPFVLCTNLFLDSMSLNQLFRLLTICDSLLSNHNRIETVYYQVIYIVFVMLCQYSLSAGCSGLNSNG